MRGRQPVADWMSQLRDRRAFCAAVKFMSLFTRLSEHQEAQQFAVLFIGHSSKTACFRFLFWKKMLKTIALQQKMVVLGFFVFFALFLTGCWDSVSRFFFLLLQHS